MIPRRIARRASYDVPRQFTEGVNSWIDDTGEVFVMLRYLASAGNKGFAFCHTHQEFKRLVENAPLGTDIEVFRDLQLPIRGRVDESFVKIALGTISEGQEYMIVAQERQPDSSLSIHGGMGDSHVDLCEELKALHGREVALGPCPPFNEPDHDGLVSASKGGIDGPR